MAADDALIQAMLESCGLLCSNKSFTADHIPVIYIDFISHQVQQIRQRQTDKKHKTHRAQSTITHTIIIKKLTI